ncbi:hypothetical protein KR018_002913, partial [Drosophila ironensis]
EMALRSFIADGMNAATIMALGDCIAQFAFEKRSLGEWDVGRTARFTCLGFVFVGPSLKTWYTFLERRVPTKMPPFRRGVVKMLIDQSTFAPVFTLAMSYIVPRMNGEPNDKILRRIREHYLEIYSRGLMLWPAAQLVNFTIVPLSYQVIYVQFIALIWNSYLSLMLNR